MSRRFIKKSLGSGWLLAALVSVAPAQLGSPAAWIAGDGSWTNGANWSGSSVPDITQQAYLTNASSKTVSLDVAGYARDLVVAAPGGALNSISVGSGGSLLVTNPMGMILPYNLMNGSILLGDLVGGSGGQGALTVNGGSVLAANLMLGPTNGTSGTAVINSGSIDASFGLRLAPAAGGSGSLVVNGGLLTSTAGASFVEIGGRGGGSLLLSNGQAVAGEMFVGRNAGGSGLVRIDGGQLDIRNAVSYAMSLGTEAGATGALVMTAGRYVNTNNLTRVGTLGVGSMSLYGGTAMVSALSIANDAGSRGNFLMTNGAVLTPNGGAFTIAGHASATGSAVVAGGTMDLSDIQVGMAGNGTLTVSNGAIHSVSMAVSASPFSSHGVFRMVGGTVTIDGGPAPGSIGTLFIGSNGVLEVSGGTLLYDVLRVQEGGTVSFSGGSYSPGGAVSNSGVFSMQHSLGVFQAPVYNAGGWITDPTTNTHFSTYTLGTNGYIQMAAGDVFIFTNGASFVNLSTNRTQTDLTVGQFVFGNATGGATQQFTAAGFNNGPLAASPTGVVTGDWSALTLANFALGTLDFGSPSNAFLELSLPGYSWATNQALYVSNLVVSGGAQLVVPNNVSVYFISSNGFSAANFALVGNAGLHQFSLLAPIPEPSTLLLAALGLGAALALRRRA